MERYFNREGLRYDRESCSFSIEHETPREVPVEGKADTLEFRLCCKALVRNGIRPRVVTAGAGFKDAVSIRVPGDGTFRLVEAGAETVNVKKIEHLLHMIVPAITKHQISAIREAAEMNAYE